MPVSIDEDFTRCSAMWKFPLAVIVAALWKIYLDGGLGWEVSIVSLVYMVLAPVFIFGPDP